MTISPGSAPRLLRRARAVRAGWLAALLIGVGWAAAVAIWWGRWEVLISAAACWMVTAFFLLAAWELVLLWRLGLSMLIIDRETLLLRLQPWLIPAALVVGLLFGHYLWG
jgi:hypothetical protein